MAEVECFFDCSSPWTYFAFHNLLELRKEMGVTIAFRPHLVGGVFNAVNPSVHNSREKPIVPKAAYSKKDQIDWARFLGIRMHYRPTVFPVNSVKAMRGCCWLEGTDKLEPFALATFDAYWGDDKDISKDDVMTTICQKAGIDPAAFFTAINDQANKDKLRNNTQELIDRGGFGSPTIFVGGDDMYFGNDRMPLIRDAVLSPPQVSLILATTDDRGVALITVNNAARRNALGNPGKRELAETVERVSARTELRVIVLTGAGDRSFISGADIAEMSTFEHEHAFEGPFLTHRVCEAIRRAPVPVIARINGYCFGAGLEIAASCDMRAAASSARFGMPEVLFGLPSGMEACLLPQLIGWGKTRELVYTGRHIDAREAAECHLVERVAALVDLDMAVEEWVSAILSAGPNAIRAQKVLMHDWERMSIADAVQQGIRAVAAAHGSEETKRLMGAFVEQRRKKRDGQT